MRITPDQAQHATAIIAREFGAGVRVWLFGSRADDSKRGGDIDIFVETASIDLQRKIRATLALTDLFDLKVDLVTGMGDQPIHRIAMATGLRLQ